LAVSRAATRILSARSVYEVPQLNGSSIFLLLKRKYQCARASSEIGEKISEDHIVYCDVCGDPLCELQNQWIMFNVSRSILGRK
jgi:hypothetical protein